MSINTDTAEKIMGWREESNGYLGQWYVQDKESGDSFVTIMRVDDWNPKEDIAQVMLCVEEITKQGWGVNIDISNGYYECVVHSPYERFLYDSHANNSKLPEIICTALLIAKEDTCQT